MRQWGIAIAFVLCAAEMQRLWGSAEAWVFLSLSLLTALVWLGEERGNPFVHRLADNIVEIMVAAILLAGLGLPAIQGDIEHTPALIPLELWAPLISAWWGLSSSRLSIKRLAMQALAFFFVLHWGLEREGVHLADEKVIICAAVIVLTRSWAMLGIRPSGGDVPAARPSFLDAATGVYARPYFEAELMHIGAVANRYHWPFSLIAIRIDGYQKLLERIGVDAAHELERKAAWLIAERIRTPDTAAHWSEGRFMVLLPSTEHHEALQLAESLRKAILASTLGGSHPVSITCGTSQHQFGDDPMETVAESEAQLGKVPEDGSAAAPCRPLHG
jgi:diguanylate cyclase (GGDEF)-like protein